MHVDAYCETSRDGGSNPPASNFTSIESFFLKKHFMFLVVVVLVPSLMQTESLMRFCRYSLGKYLSLRFPIRYNIISKLSVDPDSQILKDRD